ncbi:MAG TPA: 50S ribosomal protein L11 methyltransferase [Polyangia bacterium]|nr:50S ribosomal protein L11 methyltransferase [Polyangia bacterium]
MTDSWIEIVVELPREAADVMADAVGSLTEGVEIRDGDTIIRAGVGRAVIVSQCRPELEAEVLEEIQAAAQRLKEAGVPVDPLSVRRREAHEDEWRDVWKQYFRALRVGKTFLIRPSWDAPAAAPGDRVIDLDPGRAFGTGGHASTRLVIALAEEIAAHPVKRFLDLGCGSGILSIAAARLWPEARGVAVDLDAEAVDTTVENLERNRITTVETRVGSLDVVSGENDLLLANIEAGVLGELAGQFPPHVAPAGRVILSGILTDQADVVLQAFAAAGFALEARRDEDEWAALRLRRA